MARKRKSKRRMVYGVTFGFHDGSVLAFGPERKPSAKRIKEDGIHICPDGVFREYFYGPTYWHTFDDDARKELTRTLANRINTRRAIRELVLPELDAIKESLEKLHERISLVEKQILNASHQKGNSKQAAP